MSEKSVEAAAELSAKDLKEKKEKVEEKASRKERKKEVVEEEENGAEEEEETAEDGEEEDEGDEEDEEEEEDEDEGPALKRAAEEEVWAGLWAEGLSGMQQGREPFGFGPRSRWCRAGAGAGAAQRAVPLPGDGYRSSFPLHRMKRIPSGRRQKMGRRHEPRASGLGVGGPSGAWR
ncbi:parathymosin isoform X1 [Monodon monoceros]|uniref:parathymosin isoform X1 n=1 Tax=Monodon monoceros TaxID=40151 RepID=UPI0010F44136|nr:parathymosin isoform X1 [Monodon monoceros]